MTLRNKNKRKVFPTEEELQYFEHYAEIDQVFDFVRTTAETVKLPPTRIRLQRLDQLPPKTTLDEHIEDVFDIFIRRMIQKAGGNLKTTRYWLNLSHPAYKEKDGFWIMHKTYEMADGHTLINTIADQSQSNLELGLDETLTLTMRVFTQDKNQKKGQGGRIPDQIMKKFGMKERNVLGTTHCLPKAVVIGKAWYDMNACQIPSEKSTLANKYKSLIRADRENGPRPRLQEEEARKLLIDVGMDPNQKEHTLDDLQLIAAHLKTYRISVWGMEKGSPFPTLIHELNECAEGFIPLFYFDEHYDFFQPSVEKVKVRFCFKCHTLAKKYHWKRCKALCRRCGREECKPGQCSVVCADCHITFHSKECYDAHLKPKSKSAKPHCEKYEKCQTCSCIHRRDSYSHSPHKCFHSDYCKVCNQKESGNHECFHAMPTPAARKRAKKNQETWVMVIYDYESIVSSTAEYNGIHSLGIKHVPNLICYRLICNKCMGNYCSSCGSHQYFSDKWRPGEEGSVVERFATFLRTDRRLNNAYVVAHNGGRYDHVFTLEQLMKDGDYITSFIMSGTTFISADLLSKENNTLFFRDSVRYIPMKLDQLPGAFELETKSKGYFPYLYNHPDNFKDPLPNHPPIEYYEPKYMGVKERAAFESWYEENKHKPFDLEKELLEYCTNDVQILVEAVIKFVQICQDTFSGWHPIIQASTIASFVLFVLKHEHIKSGDVGYVSENGMQGRNNSKIALKYLLWLEHKNPELKLVHKLCSGEHRVECEHNKYYVDGYNPSTKEIYEVHGCWWHGCDKCYLDREAVNPCVDKKTMRELFDQTMAKDDDIRSSGYILHCRHTYNLLPREAMYGGRTQQFQSLVKADEHYSIEYYDFCSLYPFVNIKGTEYPKGVQKRITGDFESITKGPLPYRGLVFCDVLPPQYLTLPVLPYRHDGKLLFPLCRSCAVSKKRGSKCTHTKVSERILTGVWCTDELNLAIKKGYKIRKYHEVWHWDEEKWFRGGFFESFMTTLLKIKHEASGWPRANMTDEEKQFHINAIHKNDGIELEIENIKKNPAMRSLAKLFLNSTWGKFAQNPFKTETELMSIANALKAAMYISATGYEPKCFEEWGDTHILVSRRPVKEVVKTADFTNIVYGALTTSAARVKLYEAMEKVGVDNVIYCDTDSVIFRQKRGDDALGSLRGDALGQMTNETPSGWAIDEIVAMAPKVYALKMVDADGNKKHVTKAKGVTLNSETADMVNFETMKEMMQEHLDGIMKSFTVQRMRMKRGSNILDGLETVIEPKRLRPVMDKGNFDKEGVLTPFGLQNDQHVEDDYKF